MSKYINGLMQISAASVVFASAVVADQTNMSGGNNPQPMCQMSNVCSIYPMLNNGYGVHMDIGYLLEQFVFTGTDFAYTTDTSYAAIPMYAKMLRPKFNVASGLTAELGVYFEHDNWFLNAKFDWVSRKGRKSWTADSGSSEQVVPLGVWTPSMLGGSTLTYFTQVTDHLKVSYYDLQLDLNRGFYATKWFAFEPHAGLKAAWIYFNDDQDYTGGAAGVIGANTFSHDRKTSFWGVGPDFGINSQWNFYRHFSMFCDSTVALLCGGANVKDTAWYNTSTFYYTSAKSKPIVFSPTVRAILGFQYCSGMFDDSQNVRIRLAVDSAYYWNQFQHINVSNELNASKFFFDDNEGFGMIGMIVELGWDF